MSRYRLAAIAAAAKARSHGVAAFGIGRDMEGPEERS
jgi:hypothetical protein